MNIRNGGASLVTVTLLLRVTIGVSLGAPRSQPLLHSRERSILPQAILSFLWLIVSTYS